MSLDRGRWLILRCQGCHDWQRFHDDELDENRIVDELAAFIPAHQWCAGPIDVAVIPAQRHDRHAAGQPAT